MPRAGGEPLFTDNETNMPRVFGPGQPNRKPYVKDAFHRHVIDGEPCTNPSQIGTKAGDPLPVRRRRRRAARSCSGSA